MLSFEPRYNRGKDAEKWTLKNQIFDNFDEAPKLFKDSINMMLIIVENSQFCKIFWMEGKQKMMLLTPITLLNRLYLENHDLILMQIQKESSPISWDAEKRCVGSSRWVQIPLISQPNWVFLRIEVPMQFLKGLGIPWVTLFSSEH